MEWKILVTVFASVFIAEMADKTQIVTMLFATDKDVSKWTVFLGAAAAWAADPAVRTRAVDAAYGAFDRVDSLMSTWRDDSVLSALNRAPADTWIAVGPEVATVLAAALATAEATGGAYDPTVLPLVRLWGFRGGEPRIPAPRDLAGTRSRVDHGLLEVDGPRGRARLRAEGMEVDLGGIAKGYALDAAAAAMRAAGARGGMLDLGGNVLVFGEGPGGTVEIRDPRGGEPLAELPLAEGAVATSGQYERFVVVDGQRFGHVLDPRTGRPVPGGLAVELSGDRRSDALIVGSFSEDEDSKVVAARIIDADSGQVLETFSVSADDWMAAVDAATAAVLGTWEIVPAQDRSDDPVSEHFSSSLEAVRHFVLAQLAIQIDGDYPRGVAEFSAALANPQFRQALAKPEFTAALAKPQFQQALANPQFRQALARGEVDLDLFLAERHLAVVGDGDTVVVQGTGADSTLGGLDPRRRDRRQPRERPE